MEVSMEELANLLCQKDTTPAAIGVEQHGKCMAVLDKGFVYLGDVSTDSNYVYVRNAKNIRNWTGGHGLSWYALNGFDKDIVLDDSGDVKAPIAELKHLIECK